MVALAANGGNIKATAAALGIAPRTLRRWRDGGAGVPPENKLSLADILEDVARKILDAMPDKIEGADLKSAALAVAIAIDKARLLRGEATSIEEKRHDVGDRLTARIERLALALAGGGGGAADCAGQPVDTR